VAGVGGELVAGDHWTCQHLRQSRGRLVREPLPQQVCAFLDVWLACSAGVTLSPCAQERMDVLSVRRRTRFHLVGHCAAHRRCGRQTVWDALSRDLVWANAAVASDWRFFLRGGRGGWGHALREFTLGVVCGCFVCYHKRLIQSTDSRTKDFTPRSASLCGVSRAGSRSELKWKFDLDMMIRRSVIFALLVFNACTIQKRDSLNDVQSQRSN